MVGAIGRDVVWRSGGSWSFRSLQHVTSYHDGYWLVTVHTLGDLLPPTGKSGSNYNGPISHAVPNPNQSLLYPINAELSAKLESDKYKFGKSLVWFHQESNSCSCTLLIRPLHPISGREKNGNYYRKPHKRHNEHHTVKLEYVILWIFIIITGGSMLLIGTSRCSGIYN